MNTVENQGSEPCREILGVGRELVHLSRVVLFVPAFLIMVGIISLALNILSLLWALLKKAHNEVACDGVLEETSAQVQMERNFRARAISRRHSASF